MLDDRAALALHPCDGDPAAAVEALVRAGVHLYALDLWCPDERVPAVRDAVRALVSAAVPPFRPVRDSLAPATRVHGVPAGRAARVLYERVRGAVVGLPEGVRLLGVLGGTPLDAPLVAAWPMLARDGDALVRVDGEGLRAVPVVRARALDLPPHVERALLEDDFAALAAWSGPLDPELLRGELRRHRRGWTYTIRDDAGREVARAELGPTLGAALAAVVVAPGGTPWEVLDAARDQAHPLAPPLRGDLDDPERTAARVRTWMARIRRALAPWRASPLARFVPRPRHLRVDGPVDIALPPALASEAETACSLPPSTTTSTTGPSCGRG